MLLICRVSAAGQREGGRDRRKDKAPVVCRGGEVAGVGAESAQYLGPGPFFLSPCFLPPPCPTPGGHHPSPTPLV